MTSPTDLGFPVEEALRVVREALGEDLGGLDGVEVDHNDHDRPTREELRALAGRHGLLVTGSSDYHGTGKRDHGLGVNTTTPEVLAEIDARIAARG